MRVRVSACVCACMRASVSVCAGLCVFVCVCVCKPTYTCTQAAQSYFPRLACQTLSGKCRQR